ncbi:NfeD family protein [Oceanidesulfovibrio marinus]|uniref:NfeD-like C-terminal domain-containing protein n=1 Tax=Oceanidesulfovibrio marinus TaxID=370038 RepID=A0ABX6NHD8_9BACT|nr:hypothetical protein [Oceanidesulfovibrio marinus]QJT09564.1 hypothetical protein E8L03_11730 [Oceanidesulfovibrio marinus]
MLTGFIQSLGGSLPYLIILAVSFLVFLTMTFLSFGGEDADGSHLDSGAGGDTAHGDAPDDMGDVGDDLSHGDSHDGHFRGLVRYLSFRNLINYLMGFGAAGFLAMQAGLHPFWAANCAVAGGAIAAFVMYKLMAALYSLSEEQEDDMSDAAGQIGRVYIEIGANRSRRGKVLVTTKSAQREFAALTDNPSPLPIHASVRITACEGDCLVVEPLAE